MNCFPDVLSNLPGLENFDFQFPNLLSVRKFQLSSSRVAVTKFKSNVVSLQNVNSTYLPFRHRNNIDTDRCEFDRKTTPSLNLRIKIKFHLLHAFSNLV
jgi:hypothetical protein